MSVNYSVVQVTKLFLSFTPPQATIRDNTAHSGFAGLLILGLPSDCTAVTGFTATHQWNYAIFSSTASSLVVSRVRVAVTKVGLNVNVFGPDPVQHFIGGKTIAVSGKKGKGDETTTK